MIETGANVADLAADPRWQLVQRLCESRHFARSPKLRQFLLYVVERSLTGRTSEVTEVEIGRIVFGRGDDFVPTEDSVVRGAARQLRLKLKEYFETDGRAERWHLEIPKGGYIPVFVESAEPLVAPMPPAADPPSRSKRWLLLCSLAANIVLLTIAGWLWVRNPASPLLEDNAVSELLRTTSGPLTLVATDFSLAGMRTLTPRAFDAFTLDDYARWDYSTFQPGGAGTEPASRIFDLFRTHRLTRSGDLVLASRIARFDSQNARIRVRHARDVTAREFRSGSHILLGNPYSTPWTALFEPRMTIRWVMGGYRDVAGADGGTKDYFTPTTAYHEAGPGYARISLVPNLSEDGKVLVISGVNMVTMEAAGEFALDPNHWAEIRRALKLARGEATPYFEALLKTEAVDNTPQSAHLVIVRRIAK